MLYTFSHTVRICIYPCTVRTFALRRYKGLYVLAIYVLSFYVHNNTNVYVIFHVLYVFVIYVPVLYVLALYVEILLYTFSHTVRICIYPCTVRTFSLRCYKALYVLALYVLAVYVIVIYVIALYVNY